MARIQILELPIVLHEDGTSDTPFVVIVDQALPERYILGVDQQPPESDWEKFRREVGARAVIVTAETLDIPANEVTPATAAGAASTPNGWTPPAPPDTTEETT